VDGQSLEAFAGDLGNNLYRLWNRLASGSYFPPPVRRVEIPKASGEGTRPLGIPTVADRIAQSRRPPEEFSYPLLEKADEQPQTYGDTRGHGNEQEWQRKHDEAFSLGASDAQHNQA
jgi:hypothetical protein